MTKENYIKSLDICLTEDCECPYWDWQYHKCNMYATTNSHPWEECDQYIESEEIKNFSDKALDNLVNM